MSEEIKVLSIDLREHDLDFMPTEFFIATTDKISVNVPVQVLVEIMPTTMMVDNSKEFSGIIKDVGVGFYAYASTITSVKARIKPGTTAFNKAEAESLDEIINSSKNLTPKQYLDRQEEVNRFTGLDLS